MAASVDTMDTPKLLREHKRLTAVLVDRGALCPACEGSKILVNHGDIRPGHGWTGKVKPLVAGGTDFDLGEAIECSRCAHSSALVDPSSSDTSAAGR